MRAATQTERCTAVVKLDDGTTADCMRRRVTGTLCRQHAGIQTEPLSDYQAQIVAKIREAGTPLYRQDGGFWTCRGIDLSGHTGAWWCEIRTIRALERKGVLTRLYVHPEEWKDERGLI